MLSLVGVGALVALRTRGDLLAANARAWSDAVAAAEDGMELVKLGSTTLHGRPGDALPGGFRRQVARRPLASASGFEQVTVTVFLTGGGQFDLERLTRTGDDGSEQW